MSDENASTADLTMDEKLDRILSEMADLKAWRAQVGALLEDRARETRPKLDLIIAELADLREGQKDTVKRLDRIERQLKVLTEDVLNVRADQQGLEDRMDAIERRPN